MLTITDSNFAEMLASGKPLVVDFWAEWCGPCRAITPIITELAAEYGDKVNIGKCNVDENSDLPVKFGIRSIPTIIFFKGGALADKHIGVTTKETLKNKIDGLL